MRGPRMQYGLQQQAGCAVGQFISWRSNAGPGQDCSQRSPCRARQIGLLAAIRCYHRIP